MLVYGECECFVMQMLYVCVLCASCGSSQCCVLHDLQFVSLVAFSIRTETLISSCCKSLVLLLMGLLYAIYVNVFFLQYVPKSFFSSNYSFCIPFHYFKLCMCFVVLRSITLGPPGTSRHKSLTSSNWSGTSLPQRCSILVDPRCASTIHTICFFTCSYMNCF